MPMPMVCMATAGRAVPNVSAVGASTSVAYVNGYKLYTFNSSGVLNILRPAAGELSYLVIGGGGAGGCHFTGDGGGGGGGAGGAKQGTAVITTQQAVTVGSGGTVNASTGVPTSGGSSSIGAYVTAYGGGYGAWSTGSSSPNFSAGASGATGGGAGSYNATTRIAGTGNAGKNGGAAFNGSSTNDKQGGGGGGAIINAGNITADSAQNATGTPGTRKAGNGGAGFYNDWTGSIKGYCGGGGGGAMAPSGAEAATRGTATHGGGAGIVCRTLVGLVAGYSAVAGTANTGGGGGGGGFNTAASNRGAAGGSGVVIIRHRF